MRNELRTLLWSEDLITQSSALKGCRVTCQEDISLCSAAFLIHSGVAVVSLKKSPSDSHVNAILNECGLLATGASGAPVAAPSRPIFANASLPLAASLAVTAGFSGIGLVRFEFILFQALAKFLSEAIEDGRRIWDIHRYCGDLPALLAALNSPRIGHRLVQRATQITLEVVSVYRRRFVYLRAPDLHAELPGIKGLLSHPSAWSAFTEACIALQTSDLADSVVIAFPFTTHLSDILDGVGRLSGVGVGIGQRNSFKLALEIENAASVLCAPLWITSLQSEHGLDVAAVGIGTGDLTSTTLGTQRSCLSSAAWHPSILLQLAAVGNLCHTAGIPCVLSGAFAADPAIHAFLEAHEIIPSVEAPSLGPPLEADAKGYEQCARQSIEFDLGRPPSPVAVSTFISMLQHREK
jgi:hypothetical protein